MLSRVGVRMELHVTMRMGNALVQQDGEANCVTCLVPLDFMALTVHHLALARMEESVIMSQELAFVNLASQVLDVEMNARTGFMVKTV